jgi:hypothetical protein
VDGLAADTAGQDLPRPERGLHQRQPGNADARERIRGSQGGLIGASIDQKGDDHPPPRNRGQENAHLQEWNGRESKGMRLERSADHQG